jgi:Zn-finger nucleic acid-binding protein
MMYRCPSCTTRLDLPSRRAVETSTAGKCPVCGNGWLEATAIEITAEPIRTAPPASEAGDVQDVDVQHLVSASRQAIDAFSLRRRRRYGMAAAWLGLAVLAASPAAIAVSFPDEVVAAAPATIALYGWLDREVNIYGLAFRDVELQHLLLDGQQVIAVKGLVVNVSSSNRKIPWLRFALRSADSTEVYRWQLDTQSRPLKPGESTSFITRVAAAPETAETLEIRFARADEIGSNASP